MAAALTPFEIQKERNVRALAAICGFLIFPLVLAWIANAALGNADARDWDVYRALYMNFGGYLTKQGRDPLFVWFLDRAGDLFGGDGYERFRIAVVALFAWSGAWIVARAIWAGSMPVATLIAVLAAFFLKSLIQIREGVAFLVIVWATLTAFRGTNRGLIWSGLGALIAVGFHAGTVVFLGAWIGGVGLLSCGRGILMDRTLPVYLVLVAIAVGLGVAWWVQRNELLIVSALKDFGVEQGQGVAVSTWKYVYWTAMGLMALILMAELRLAAYYKRWFSFAYATALGSFVIPMIYVICLSEVFGHAATAAMASIAIRLLLSTMELALLIIAAAGKARWPTLLVASFMLADQARLLLAS